MVKHLHDICLNFIQSNLDKIPNAGERLPTVHKEQLLERIADHDLLIPEYIPFVIQQLFFSSLRHVTFYKCDQVTDEFLCVLANQKCVLDSLTIQRCQSVTDVGIKKITDGQDELSYLRLRRLTNITSSGLSCIRSSKLQTVDLTGCLALTVNGIKTLVNNNPSIRCMNIDGCHKLYDDVFAVIAQGLRGSLEDLDGNPHVMRSESLKTIAKYCPNLKRLNLHGCSNLNGEAVFELSQNCQELQHLDLSYCNGLRSRPHNEYFWTLPTSLTSLSLCGILLDDETLFIECVQRLKRLKHIRLSGVTALNDETFSQILQHIGKGLICLDISGTVSNTLTDEGLKSVTRYCKSLEQLDFSMCHSLTLTTLVPLLENPDTAMLIKKLFVSTKKLNLDVLLTAADHCYNLEMLDVAGQRCITDELLRTLARNCPKLHRIGMKGCAQVTDEGVCELARKCDLHIIVLSGILNLTDKSIFCIANHCHMLEEIYLNGCSRISGTTVSYLIDCCIPRLYVQHILPNHHPDQLMAKNLDTGEFCRADFNWTVA
ncbi:F-box/LRR-repeat protein fbxl-1-like isoform X1 [Mytilus californianus]|uniref:F-box/LRR-repeat protein fbxl-1-like isoform X1 n=2 Tax=Mytilus californianus TaxID=6549 RepID=UPI002245B8F1|nr:F-box/LRR-repeat protein fbxl-1-like isoform X1 [Mytilus californianus]XP_052099959.1 F-box/LRR-repeat protein fbxl-1-like isoform X1 [Mytilus californianus]